eukprot:GFUD01009520.1.p1 GENE.GFUD01009520.1~~GFUD01009520.1.p1  ORF type:complete len:981 (+),score=238.89 GFUD01009520.1:139-3081(+)
MDEKQLMWGALGSLLVILSVGIVSIVNMVVLLVIGILTSFLVFILTIFAYSKVNQDPLCSRLKKNSMKEQLKVTSQKPIKTFTILTGSSAIDKPLQDMISYIIRDYILAWHKKITLNTSFPDEVRAILSQTVTILTERISLVDWVPYLTTQLVDHVASHVRLFKSARNKYKSPLKDGEARPADLETIFFDCEVEMEGEICRDQVCLDQEGETQYFQELCEMLLYLILPGQEFGAGSVRCLVREILAHSLIQPSLNSLSDPDFVNQTLVWLYSEYDIRNEVFVATLRHTDNMGELEASKELVTKEITRLRSCDSVTDDEGGRLQLNSLLYLKKVIDTKISRIQSGFSGNSYGLPANIDWSSKINPNTKLFNLPLEVILKNNIALSYFIDYMSAISCQHFVFFYLNIEGWKVSAEQQIQAMELEFLKTGTNEKHCGYLESIREAALSIYQEYLSDKASPRLNMEDSLNKKLLLRIRSESPDPGWFDEVASAVYSRLEQNDQFLNDFKRSVGYLKLLAELDLLKGELDDDEDISIGDSASLNSYDGSYKSAGKSEASSGSDGVLECEYVARLNGVDRRSSSPSTKSKFGHSRNASVGSLGKSEISEFSAEIVTIDLARENGTGKQYVNYVVVVKRKESKWEILRRYSDFFFFHQTITNQYSKLAKIPFPGKKTFGNLERNVVEKRKKMLNEFFHHLLIVKCQEYPGLYDQIFTFLSPGWEANKQNVVERAVSAVSHDIQRSVKTVSTAVTAMPSHFVKNVDNVVDGISKVFNTRDMDQDSLANNMKVGASIDQDHDNIPLRITMLLLDEVFDLADRNIWLRRQMITVLRQIVKTMFGDTVNKKIVDYFTTLTSPDAVSDYLNNMKDNFWPGGFPAAEPASRDESQRMRTRVAAKASLFSSMSDELRRVIGSETSRAGLSMLFEMLQFPALNRRLVIVILEGGIQTIFPDHDFNLVFNKLHSRSSRVRNDLKNSQRTSSDLRRH